MDRKLVGTATRYIAGRNAIQTVYWRKTADVEGRGLLKYSKTHCLGKAADKGNVGEMFAQVRQRYS